MDRVYEKSRDRKSSRDDRDKEHRDSTKDNRDRDRDHHKHHRTNRDKDTRSAKDHYYDDYEEPKHRERSHEPRERREGNRDERVTREESVERRYQKRKERERGDSEERLDKRRKEEKREKRRFEDKDFNGKEEKREIWEVEDNRGKEELLRDENKNVRRERRRFGDRANEEEKDRGLEVKSEKKEIEDRRGASDRSSSATNGAAVEPLKMTANAMAEHSLEPDHHPIKVSSISTTNENKGVSVTRSHEVPEKSSTDGTTASAAGKTGSLSLDALAKAKKTLQKQKEIREKLKKIPLLNKVSKSNSDGTHAGVNKEGSKPPLPSMETQALSSASITPAMASASANSSSGGVPALAGLAVPNIEAVKRAQELAAKMGFYHDPAFAPVINMFPGQMPTDVTVQQKPSKAPVLRLDQFGNEIDEHGNVINMSKPANLSTLKVNINKQKKDAFQILKPELDVDPEANPHFDERMGINKEKLIRPKRLSFQFVEEGQWSKQAEIIKIKSRYGEAQAKELKTKQAQLAKAKAEPDINPNLIEVSERIFTKEKPKDPIPEVEWWDAPLLVSGNYGDITEENISKDKLRMDKITCYVEHPLPIEPPAEPAPPPPQPLKLTKKEQKKLRTQRRLAKEKDRQEMIRQGLIEPPKAKIKMSNLMKVLGSEATQDPTRLEMEIRSAAAEREQAHVDRNIARKLTPAERREKKERKLFEDPNTLETIVSVYKINNLSHPQTRFKVDVNAQENRLTGCVVIADSISVVVVEGGSKPIKRYGKLMLKRINWATAVAEEDGDEDEDKPANKCVLVWQGSVAKPNFNKFLVHQCRTEAAARKVFSDAGVPHYWDLAVNFADDETQYG